MAVRLLFMHGAANRREGNGTAFDRGAGHRAAMLRRVFGVPRGINVVHASIAVAHVVKPASPDYIRCLRSGRELRITSAGANAAGP
jgi:hypothetical protein